MIQSCLFTASGPSGICPALSPSLSVSRLGVVHCAKDSSRTELQLASSWPFFSSQPPPATSCQFLAGKVLWGCMASATLNVSLSKEQLALVNREVDSGQYISAGEVVREALREWLNRRIEAD